MCKISSTVRRKNTSSKYETSTSLIMFLTWTKVAPWSYTVQQKSGHILSFKCQIVIIPTSTYFRTHLNPHTLLVSKMSIFSAGGVSCSRTPETTPLYAPRSWVESPGWAASSASAMSSWSLCPSTTWRITTAGARWYAAPHERSRNCLHLIVSQP